MHRPGANDSGPNDESGGGDADQARNEASAASGDEASVPDRLLDPRTQAQVLRAHKLESVGQLAAGVAHDFNNILGVILGYVELARMNMEGVDAKVHRHLDLALSTLGRARALADRLLDFTREEDRAADLCDLNEAVQEVRELLAETLDRRIKFEVNLGGNLPPPPLDADSLRQVVTNLCLNAADAMPEGGRVIVDTFRREVQPGGLPELPPGIYSGLRVRDTGPGVPLDQRERVFQPYYTSRPGKHSGMGLWVVRGLVEKYDGRIDVGGDEHGAVFTVWLPSELHVWERNAEVNGEAVETAEDSIDVLIVDDEPGVRDITRAFLEMDGYRVLEAETGRDALVTLRARPGGVRVVFLDHLLPDIQGSELAWQIDRMDSAPQVVMVTGMPDAASGQELPAGTRVLAKPFLHADVTKLLRDDLGIEPVEARV